MKYTKRRNKLFKAIAKTCDGVIYRQHTKFFLGWMILRLSKLQESPEREIKSYMANMAKKVFMNAA